MSVDHALEAAALQFTFTRDVVAADVEQLLARCYNADLGYMTSSIGPHGSSVRWAVQPKAASGAYAERTVCHTVRFQQGGDAMADRPRFVGARRPLVRARWEAITLCVERVCARAEMHTTPEA